MASLQSGHQSEAPKHRQFFWELCGTDLQVIWVSVSGTPFYNALKNGGSEWGRTGEDIDNKGKSSGINPAFRSKP
jgi:hypothetical protein